MVGKTLSHYKILSELGRGGMGIVYEAEDDRLGRRVAIKVLPAAALSVEDDRARFYREARAAASLSHPNIAVVHEIDEAAADGEGDVHPFIAMELIDGETLDARIRRGPLDLPDAIRIATEVADALKTAHANDIVHRDIKSANIMIDQDGRSKILDFGLAKTTQSTQLTRMGSTLGTIAYMSPEQARGEEVDKRTDLWAVGVLLYEMISGSHPFSADYEQATVYTILNEDPAPLTAIRTGVPMDLEHIVGKCLKKDADHRYQHADDLIADLKGVDTTNLSVRRSAAAVSPAPAESRSEARLSWWMLPFGITLILVGAFGGGLFQSSTPDPVLYLDVDMASQSTLAISDDGKLVAFKDSSSGISIKNLETGDEFQLQNSVGFTNPAFSPEGDEIAFSGDHKLVIVPLLPGSPPRVVLDEFFSVGIDWTDTNEIIWSENFRTLNSVSLDTGERRVLVEPSERFWGFARPVKIPGTNVILASSWGSGPEIVAIHLDRDTSVVSLNRGAWHPQFVAPDIVTYMVDNQLFGATYDHENGDFSDPVLLKSQVASSPSSQQGIYAVSTSGSLLAFHHTSDAWSLKLEKRPFDGPPEVLYDDLPGIVWELKASPQQDRIAFSMFRGTRDSDIWLYPMDARLAPVQLTETDGFEQGPKWSQDGAAIFHSYQSYHGWHALNRSVESDNEPDTVGVREDVSSAVLANGELLVSRNWEKPTGDREWWSTNGGEELIQLLSGPFGIGQTTRMSPNANWLAYLDKPNGSQILASAIASGALVGSPYIVSENAADPGIWSRDSRRLYFLEGDGLFRVSVDSSPPFSDKRRLMDAPGGPWDLLPDESGIIAMEDMSPAKAIWIQGVRTLVESGLAAQSN